MRTRNEFLIFLSAYVALSLLAARFASADDVESVYLLSRVAPSIEVSTAMPESAPVEGISPHWSGGANHSITSVTESVEVNESFLMNHNPDVMKNNLNLYDTKKFVEMRQQYDDMNRDYDMRANYHLVDEWTERNHENQMTDFSRNVFNEVQHYQTSQNMKKLNQIAENSPEFQAIKKPVGLAAGVAAVYSGQPIKIDVSRDTKITTMTNVPNQRAGLQLSTPLVNTQFDFIATAPTLRSSVDPTDPNGRDERYRLSFNRTLPIVNIGTGLTYASSSRTMIASLSKPLVNNVTCVFDSTLPLDPAESYVTNSEETVKLLYGFRF